MIAYGSRTLTPAEKNYSLHSGKLEFLALKWSVAEFFRDYLYYSNDFVLYTDNNSLTYVLSTANLMLQEYGEYQNWLTLILRLDIDQVGVHRDADGLFKMPMDFEK